MSERPLLVILNPTCLDVLEAHRDYLDSSGVTWIADPAFRSLGQDQVDGVLAGADALILPSSLRNLPLAEHMERHSALKVLSIAASGFDWLDVEAATRSGIVVTHAPIREGVEVVADMTWGLMLAVARQIPHHDRQVRAGRYDRGTGVSVWGKTLGIVGLGRIGRAVARRAAGFEMRVLAAEPKPDHGFVREHEIELTSLEELLRRADFVTLHVRLDARTFGMIGGRELAMMKPSAYLVNAARADLVDGEALAAAILGKAIAGAALDDPPAHADSPLLGLPNVVFTPHLGNRAIEGMHAVFRRAIDNALAVLEGRRPELVVNPEVYERPPRAARKGGSPTI
jgi:D-3-phosphoglycerate dehydrogenase